MDADHPENGVLIPCRFTVMVPLRPGNAGGGKGPPTIRDRVVQTAAKLVVEPIFEADLDPAAYGYRPGRSGTDAIKAVHALLCRGYIDVVDADLSKLLRHDPASRADAVGGASHR